jgi:RNA polymerase sigma-70 factor (ECF subfamily)
VHGDPGTIEAVLAPDVTTLTDGGGEFHAARKLVVGRDRVALFYRRLAEQRAPDQRMAVCMLNGFPALVCDFGSLKTGYAPRGVVRVDVGDDGLVRCVHSVLATRKLTAVRFP